MLLSYNDELTKGEIQHMAIADIIKYEGDNDTFIWKHPCEDFNSMTQLIVHESQEAIFFMNGQALDLFGPGRHTLQTQNLPRLGKLLTKITGGNTPFHCEVYFINKTVQMSLKWGTDSRVRFLDPNLGIPLDIGACGEMSMAVCDSRKLLVNLVGTMKGIAWGDDNDGLTRSIQSSFRPLISTAVKANLASAIKSKNINVLEIDEHLSILSETLRMSILGGFEEYGLTIPEFYITNIALPEDDPNFKRMRDLHTLTLHTRMIQADAVVRSAKADADAEVTAAQRRVEMEKQQTETEVARREAERELIRAQAEAQKIKLSGFAEAEVMRAKGYDQKDVLDAEVKKAYAEGLGNMTISGGGGVASDIIGLGVGMAAAGAVVPKFGDMIGGFGNTAVGSASASASLVCRSCGAALEEKSKFCPECGERVVRNDDSADGEMIVCPQCGSRVKKGRFCLECGHKFVTRCPKCGVDVAPGAKFCPECGEKL